MKNLSVSTLTLLAALVGIAAVPAMAQSEPRIDFTSPVAFNAGLAKLPAGNYSISKQDDVSGIYLISNRNSSTSTLVIARTASPSQPGAKPNVSFTQRDGKYYLESVGLASGAVVEICNTMPAETRAALMVRKVRPVK